MAQFPHLLVMCTRHRLAEVVTAVQSGWRQLEEVLARNHAQNLPEKVYLPQRTRPLGKGLCLTGGWSLGPLLGGPRPFSFGI